MRRRMKARLVLLVPAALAALAIAGCGGGGGGEGGDPASLAPAAAPLFIEGTVRPEGELQANVESLAQRLAGIDDLGGLIVGELESSASDSGEEFDYEQEVEPWLGKDGGLFFQRYDGDDFSGYGVIVQTTDAGASQSFLDKQAKQSEDPFRDASYEDVDYKVEEDGTSIGVVEDFVVIAEDEQSFKAAVDASADESLADQEAYTSAIDAAPSDSLAEIFVDVGDLIEQSGDTVDPEALKLLDSAGIDPRQATAVASLVPGSNQVEIDLSSDLGGEDPPSGDASELLGSLPADSVAAFAFTDFGERIAEAVDSIDKEGFPGEVPPNQLKDTLKQAGVDLDKITASLGDLGVFAVGNSERNLGGAAVLTTDGSGEATDTVATIGKFLRSVQVPGVTALEGEASGFSIRSPELGSQPLVVAAAADKIAIAYGLVAAKEALAAVEGDTLADTPAYEKAVEALGGTPISGFADGPAALRLASALVPADDEGFRSAKPYLTKIDYVALGAGSAGDLATAKLIVGVGR
jgi:hypothetical protein